MGVMQVMRSLLMAQPHRESIVGTGVATFNTDFKAPMKLSVPMTYTQDLHGMPNPYPPGASVNLIPDGTDTSNGYVDGCYLMSDDTTVANANLYVSEFFEVDPTVTYTWSNAYNPTNPSICFYDENKNFISGIASAQQMPITFTPPEGAVYARSSQTKYSYQASNPTLNNCYQLEVGSTATAYRRYSNICPITGFSSTVVCHTGANLIPKKRTNYNRYMSSGQIKGASSFKLFYMRIPPKKNIYFRSNKDNVIAYIALTNSTALNAPASQSGTMTYRNTWDMSARDGYNFAAISKQNPGLTDAGITSGQAMLSFDSYKTFKEPQDNQYIGVAFTDPTTGDPVIVYSGTLTLNEDGSADILVTKAGKTVSQLSGNPYISYGGLLRWDSINNLFPGFIYSGNYNAPNAIATMLRGVGDTPIVATDAYRGTFAFGSTIFWISDNTCATAEAYLQKYADCLIVWDLDAAHQQVYHLDNVGLLKSFIGQNHVWTYLNGNPTVGYWKHG